MAYPGRCYNRDHLRTGQPSPFSSYIRGLDERLGLRPPESTTDTASAPLANTTSPPTPASAQSSALSPAAQATPALLQTEMSSHHERRSAPPVAFGQASTRRLAPQHLGAGEQAAHVASSAPALPSAFGHAAAPSTSSEGPWVAARTTTPSHQLAGPSSNKFYDDNDGRMNARPHYQAVPHSYAGNARGAMSTPSSPMDPRMYSDDFNSVHGRASFSAVPNSTRRSHTEHSLQARRISQPANMMTPSTLPPYPRLPTDFTFGQNYGYAVQPFGYGDPQSSTLDASSIPRTLAPFSPSAAQYNDPSPATSSISAAERSFEGSSRKRTRESEDAAVERSAKRARLGAGLAESDVGETAAMGSLPWHDDALSSPAFLLNRPHAAKGKGLTAKELELFHKSVEWSISVYARYWIV